MMLLIIQILFLAYIVQKVQPQDLNVDIQEKEINFRITGSNKTGKHSTFRHSELLLYSQNESSNSPNLDTNRKTSKDVRSNLFEVKSGKSQGKRPIIINMLKNVVDINKEDFSENAIEFDLRKREDTYKKTNPKEYPYAVSLVSFLEDYNVTDSTSDKFSTCSGTLLTEEWVLTAGHCITDETGKIYVYAGGNSAKEVVDHVRRHKPLPFTSQLLISASSVADEGSNDIGLIKLPAKFNITDTVKTVKLSSKPWNYHGYQACVTTGFGDVELGEVNDDDLTRKTHELEVKQPCMCSFLLNVGFSSKSQEFMCSKPGNNICVGDSGGGLVCDGKVQAVNSAGISFEDVKYCDFNFAGKIISSLLDQTLHTQCGGKNTFSIFQAICPSLGFINEHVKLFSDSEISECLNRSAMNSASVRTLLPFSYLVIVNSIILMFLIM